MSHRVLLVFFVFYVGIIFSQREANNWHFGYNCHLSFQTGLPIAGNTPTIVGSGSTQAMYFQNSSLSLSDSSGTFLFAAVVSSLCNVHPSNLVSYMQGNSTLTNSGRQTLIAVRKGGKRYYVVYGTFFLSTVPPNVSAIRYSEVDMALNSGLGSATSSQNTLSPGGMCMMQNVTATQHCNKSDYWVLAHELNSNKFYAYLATSQSINPTPVISSIGSIPNPNLVCINNTNYSIFKFSPNGRKLAVTMPYRTVELYDFDNATGILTNSMVLENNYVPGATATPTDGAANGLEFSPDGTKLYVSYVINHPFLCQYDLCAGTASAIAASKTVISNTILAYPARGELQTGPDGKIYVAHYLSDSIGVINNPNALGSACNYSPNSVSIGSNITPSLAPYCESSFPYFISNYFEQKPALPPISGSIACGNAQFAAPTLCAATGYSITGYTWHFGDALSGAANTSTLPNPTHVFSANGTYTVKLTLQYPCSADTLKQVVTISGLPTLSVSGKTSICKGEKTVLTFSGATTYSVNSVATAQSTSAVQPTVSATYTIAGAGAGGCVAKSTVSVSVLPCLGILASNSDLELAIYPSPANNQLTVETSKDVLISVLDELGRLVLQKTLNKGTSQLNIEGLAKGIYVVRTTNQNGVSKTLRFVKE